MKVCPKCGEKSEQAEAWLNLGVVYRCANCGGGFTDQCFFPDTDRADAQLANALRQAKKAFLSQYRSPLGK